MGHHSPTNIKDQYRAGSSHSWPTFRFSTRFGFMPTSWEEASARRAPRGVQAQRAAYQAQRRCDALGPGAARALRRAGPGRSDPRGARGGVRRRVASNSKAAGNRCLNRATRDHAQTEGQTTLGNAAWSRASGLSSTIIIQRTIIIFH